MKELTKTYGDLLQDKRVRAEQSKYETITRQRNSVMARYKKIYDSFNSLRSGITQAQTFYTEMTDTVDNLKKNVDTFINNRRTEGAQLLAQIEREKSSGSSDQEEREREKLRQLMERLSTEPKPSSVPPPPSAGGPAQAKSPPPPIKAPAYPTNIAPPKASPHFPSAVPQHHGNPISHSPAPYGQYMPPGTGVSYIPSQSFQQGAAAPLSEGYNPMAYPVPASSMSPPPSQHFYSPAPTPFYTSPTPPVPSSQYMPQGYVPPPPPPRPQQTTYPPSAGPFPSGPGGYAQSRPYGSSQHNKTHSQSSPQSGFPSSSSSTTPDPWAGLNAWK